MKIKILLTLLTAITTALNAQTWSGMTPGNIFYNSGSVGIGTTTPLSKLTVQNSVNSSSIAYPLSIASLAPDAASGSGVGMSFYLGGNSTESQRREHARITVKQTYYGVRPTFTISTTEYNSPYTAFMDRFTISPLGNIGIGTTNPSERLTVFTNGTLATNNDVMTLETNLPTSPSTNTTVGLNFNLSQGSNPAFTYASIRAGEDTGTGLGFGAIRFLTQKYNNGSVLTEHMRISSIGNVLIGKTSQVNTAYKLDVSGSIRSNEVVVNTTGADFVFERDFRLKSLEEVEKYINTNKHLPDIEPAKEMEEKGLELGKMDMKLLQKIEELTLYMIDFKKEMDKMKQENQKLKNRILELEKD
jgi:hypothetical protein